MKWFKREPKVIRHSVTHSVELLLNRGQIEHVHRIERTRPGSYVVCFRDKLGFEWRSIGRNVPESNARKDRIDVPATSHMTLQDVVEIWIEWHPS